MKFIHIADMHLDSKFVTLNNKTELGEMRRLEQKEIFKKIIQYIKKEAIPYLFISGDLYEHEYIREGTIKYINQLFESIPNTQIYISPGNHDPNIKNSYYAQFDWSKNVYIFDDNIKKYENSDIVVYGYGFTDFYCMESPIKQIKIEDKSKINILVMHASLNSSNNAEKQYNSVSQKELEELGFDYIALGHIHKTNFEESKQQNILYPGSTISMGFDELGEHGMLLGDIEKDKLDIKFISLDKRKFIELEINIESCQTIEELIDLIKNINLEKEYFYKIILKGFRQFEINTNMIEKLIQKNNIIKIKDETRIDIQLDKLVNEFSLKGIFAKEILMQMEKENNKKDVLEKALEIGLEILEE